MISLPPRQKRETRAERVLRFIDTYCVVPEGKNVGQPLKLLKFQRKFIKDVFDNPAGTRRAILSIARKNGKTGLIACLLLAFIVGPEKRLNSQIVSGALSRDQAALVFNLASKMLDLQPAFIGLYKIVYSAKRIYGIAANVEYRALAADGGTALGISPVLAILDEVGQVRGPTSPFIEAITTSQGAHEHPLLIAISTQSPSDADCLSLWIDDAERSGDPHTISHLHCADPGADLDDPKQWKKANPAMNEFRSKADLEENIKRAQRIPALESSARNLLLNQRVSLQSLWLAPRVWKSCSTFPEKELFTALPVVIGLDLSSKQDLTAAVASVRDENGCFHLIPFCFTPLIGIEERSRRDRTPYAQWVKDGMLVAVPGLTIDYTWVISYLQGATEKWPLRGVAFDRWRIDDFKRAAEEEQWDPGEWESVGQGYKDFSPRIEVFEEALLSGKIRHGNHPLLTMAAASAITNRDPAGNRKLDKSKSTLRIDPLVAAVMSVGSTLHSETGEMSDSSLFFV